jgi:hypothetical protein
VQGDVVYTALHNGFGSHDAKFDPQISATFPNNTWNGVSGINRLQTP